MDLVKTLKSEVEAYLGDDENRVIHDFDSVPEQLIVKAAPYRPAPPFISLLIGEFLYHLRAALNNLVCELAQSNGEVVDDSMEFPIFSHAPLFGDRRDRGSASYRRIHKLAPGKQAIIEGEQPFNAYPNEPDFDPLWFLYQLSNADRHKALHVTRRTVRSSTTVIEPAIARLVPLSRTLGPVENETEIARFGVVNAGPAITVRVTTDVKWDIAFAKEIDWPLGNRFVLPTLGDIALRVGDVLERVS